MQCNKIKQNVVKKKKIQNNATGSEEFQWMPIGNLLQ
jgi:hypothetical protein